MTRSSSVVVAGIFCAALTILVGESMAQSGTWLGTVDNEWCTSNNWSRGEWAYYSGTATFDNAGNNRTEISFRKLGTDKMPAIKVVEFKTPNCAAYTIGSDGQNFG